MPSLKTAAITAATVLATIYLYNRFMEGGISQLGVPSSK